MNEISDAAVEAAQEATNEFSGDMRLAFLQLIQRSHDTGLQLRNFAMKSLGFEPNSGFVRLIQSLMLPGVDPVRKRDLPHAEPCPLCGDPLRHTVIAGEPRWLHTTPDEGDEDRCMFANLRLRADQLPKWNMRVKPKQPAQIAGLKGPCGVCGSLTPESYSRVCGNGAACPHN